MASRVDLMASAALLHLQTRAIELVQSGHTVHSLILGESDLPTPAHIVQAGAEALRQGHTCYPPGPGFPELREAIAAKLQRFNRLKVDPATDIFVTNSSGFGVYLALLATVEPGDAVLVSDPTYGPFLDAIRLAGAEATFVRQVQDPSGQLRWDPDAFSSTVSARTRAIIINTPSAPTGAVMSEDELRAVGALAVRHDLVIISDEVFETLLFDDRQHVSIAALGPAFAKRTVSVFSLSKTYAMTGWRLGYNAGPPQLIKAMGRVAMAFGRSSAAFTQQAGIAALNGPQDFVASTLREYSRRRELVEAALEKLPQIRWLRPEGAFYIFVDFSHYGCDSMALAERLLREAHVLLTPGSFYGPAGQGWLRLSFAGSLDAVLAGIARLEVTLSRWG